MSRIDHSLLGETRSSGVLLHPTSLPGRYGDSPYQGFSAFAGNPNLIALEPLEASGLLEETDLAGWRGHDSGDPTRVDFRAVIPWKKTILQKAFSRFQATDYALFMALKELHEGVGWPDWQKEFRDRDPGSHPTISARPVNSGATPYTGGRTTRRPGSSGGRRC